MPISTYVRTPVATDALQDAYAIRAFADPLDFSAFNAQRVDGVYFLKPMQDEVLALVDSSVARRSYGLQYTCLAGDAVGDPVYLQAANTVNKADATTAAKAKVLGFICHKGAKNAASSPTATTCYLVHYRYISGLSGGTAGNPVYLTDAGSFGASAGTIAKVVGVWLSATEAVVYASQQYLAFAQNPGNETAGEIPFYASTGQLDTDTKLNWDNTNKTLVVGGTATAVVASAGIEAWADDTMRIRALTYHASNYPRLQTYRGRGTKAAPAAVSSGDFLGLFQSAGLNTTPAWYAATAFGAFADGAPTADYVPGGFFFEVADGAGATAKVAYVRANSRFQINGTLELGGTAFSDSADTGTILKTGRNAAPSAWTAASNTAAQDIHIRTQSGGAHVAANPRGGDLVITPGAAGAGGTGRAGEFRVDGIAQFANEGIHIFDTNASHDLVVKVGSDLTVDRILTLTTGDADRTVTLSGNPTLADWFDQSVKTTASPTHANLTLSNTNAILTLAATVEEDADEGRESDIVWKGEQSGGEQSTLGRIRMCHDGAADDEKGQLIIYLNDGNDGSTPTERFILSAAGNIGLGMTPYDVANQTGIAINGTNYSRIDMYSGGAARFYFYSGSVNTNFGTNGATYVGIDTNATERFRITDAGAIYFYALGSEAADTAVSYDTASKHFHYDSCIRALKTNVRDLDIDSRQLQSLRLVGFDRASTGKPDIGMIIEEAVQVCPMIIGRDGAGIPVGMRHGQWLTLLTAEIQRLHQEVEALKAA